MSQRHRSSKSSAPGAATKLRPSRSEREEEHRRLRHRVNQDLHTLDVDEFDDAVLDTPHHTSAYETAGDAPTEAPKRRLRHWKMPFWKRRNLERARRAEAEQALITADDDPS